MSNRDHSFRLKDNQWDDQSDGLYVFNTINSATLASHLAESNITFNIQQEPVLELKPDGSIYVQGRLAANDRDVVDAMRIFLGSQGLL